MSEELTQQLPGDILRQILARLDSMDARLTALEDKVDRRLQETRPIWEGVLEQLKEVNARLDRTETRLDSIEKEIGAMRRWFRQTFFEMGRDHDSLEERVENIEARLKSQETPPT
jgi:chromosome segregation ATPase